jgi:hypothetical protein
MSDLVLLIATGATTRLPLLLIPALPLLLVVLAVSILARRVLFLLPPAFALALIVLVAVGLRITVVRVHVPSPVCCRASDFRRRSWGL